MENKFSTTVIAGSKVAGEESKLRKQLESLVKNINSSLFDLSDLLWSIKKNGYYSGFTTFREYTKSIGLKESKSRYLPRVAEVMEEMGIPRSQYELLGMAKLREITSLNVNDTWVNPETKDETPMKAFIQGLVDKGKDMPLEEIKQHVKTLKGLVGDEAMAWLHLYMKEQALDKVARPALELAKAQIGSVGKNDEGISKDASDGAAAEMIFASFLADPANEVLAGELGDANDEVVSDNESDVVSD